MRVSGKGGFLSPPVPLFQNQHLPRRCEISRRERIEIDAACKGFSVIAIPRL